ncbi:MAG: NADH-quinone oxidoreductase subunit NuoF [Candidatus Bathyarchaeota archaeon]|nr:NADH-quinone oxidoreductase subunit NuoF [Candidatus Bathyarchaeota archaeon]MDH5713185.1 NADH-quinone oxidoreductase subunit NuoF [Candidatus Bathyarchaeota archaeon]
MKKIRSRGHLEEIRRKLLERKESEKRCITISSGTCGRVRDSQKVVEAIYDSVKKHGAGDKVCVRVTGCHGFCQVAPIVVIYPDGIFYQRVKAKDAEDIITKTILNNRIVNRLLYVDPTTEEKIVYEKDVPFFRKQMRLLLGNNRFVDPTKLEDYIAVEGYKALCKVLFEMKPEEVIEEIKKSGLRGRGGAGFPTGVKWESCRKAEGDIRYVVCNADEGDPGAYMDRSLLEGNPHSIIEGMIIGAYAIGAHDGYIYVRYEYPLAIENTRIALDQAREYGLLGKNILDSGFDFDIKIAMGGGAFVCGESTALMASIEGKMGEPRAKYIHTVERGLWNKPTNLNNVKTWANVPLIINNGADWYSKIGTEKSKGTGIFSLVGKINNTGLVEIPMGTPLRQIIYDIGGGIPGSKKFKAVQTGGPSGGCIPEKLLDLPVDFEKLTEAGSMMGSGGMIVMDENTCMVDMARYFLDFLADESCGKCFPCREGIKRMLEIVVDITKGRAKEEDLGLLQELAEMVKDFSLCGLGKTAPNPVLSTLRYFRDEYGAHVRDKKCPAGICKDLIEYFILEDKCTGCGACLKLCPQQAIQGEPKKLHIIDPTKCIRCGICRDACPYESIMVK